MISVFLPCRKGSQRIPNKNIKPFAGIQGGLLEIKLAQLKNCGSIDRIVVSSNDARVLEYAEKARDSRIVIDERPDHLGSSETTTDDLIRYVENLIQDGIILWTHVTSPFVTSHHYELLLDQYSNKISEGYDSLMTAKKIQGFLWSGHEPINYDRAVEKWPRTQTIEPWYEIDSAAFIASAEIYKKYRDRIGVKPFIAVQEEVCSIDIDWPEDFVLAEKMYEHYKKR